MALVFDSPDFLPMSATTQPPERDGVTPPARTKEWAKTTAETILTTIREGDPRNPDDTGHCFCANCHARLKEVQPPKPDAAFYDRYPDDGAPKWVGGGHLDFGTVKELVHGEESMVTGSISVTGELDLTDFDDYRYADSPVSNRASIGRAFPTQNATRGLSDGRRCDSRRHRRRDTDDEGDDDDGPAPKPWLDNPRQTLVCKCGVANHRYIERPISQETAVKYAKNLSDSIESIRADIKHEVSVKGEKQVPEWRVARIKEWRHSRDVLVEAVHSLKGRRDMQGKKKIFEASLALALQKPSE